MAIVLGFNGLLPEPEKAHLVAAVPYDVVNSEEAAVLAKGNNLSFLRISRPEIEMEAGIDLYRPEVYEKAKTNFKRLIEAAPLKKDKEKNIYVYSLKMGDHIQTGLAAVFSTDEYDKDIIKKHEKTRKDKEDDRTRHIVTLKSHTGPVFLTYRDRPEIDALVAETMSEKPYFEFTAPDGIYHSFWKAGENRSLKISKLFKNVENLYIADGHHRAAAASRTAAEMRKNNPKHTEKEDYNYFLAVVFPASQLKVLPYNRVVKDLNGLSKDNFLREIRKKFEILPASSPSPSKPAEICMFFDGKWQKLTPKFSLSDLGPIEQLDVSILQDNILAPLLGIDDPKTSKRIDFVGGIRGTKELEKLVNTGKHVVAFSMFPTTVAQVMAVSDAGGIMPPKSTWFEPKLRDGMVCHTF